jgi:hypothetical protein
MFRISLLDRSEVAPKIATSYDKAFALHGNNGCPLPAAETMTAR